MDVIEKEQLSLSEAKCHWYYTSKYMLLRKQMSAMKLPERPSIADCGCGAGLFLSMIEDDVSATGTNLVGIDPAYKANALIPGTAIPVAPEFPLNSSFDLILLMDVLEHVPDPQATLSDVAMHCRGGGFIFVTLPAHMLLWSRHDEYLGHYKRFNRKAVNEIVSRTQCLTIQKLFYYFATILPIAAPMRLIRRFYARRDRSDMRPANCIENYILKRLLRWELVWTEYNRVAGLSVVAVLQKNKITNFECRHKY